MGLEILAPVLMVALFGLSGLGVGGYIKRVSREARARRWRDAAIYVGGTLHTDARGAHRIEATIDGLAVRGWHEAPSVGRGSQIGDVLRFTAVGPGVGALGLQLSTGLHLKRDLVLGDAAIDAAYHISASSPELLRAWLDAPARAAILSAGTDFVVRSEGDTMHASRQGLPEADQIAQGLQLVATLAGGGLRLRVAWAALADALGARLAEVPAWPPCVIVASEGAPCTLRGAPVAELRRELRRASAQPGPVITGGLAAPGAVAAWTDVVVTRALDLHVPEVVVERDAVRITFAPAAVPDADQVRAALAVAALFDRDGGGAYR